MPGLLARGVAIVAILRERNGANDEFSYPCENPFSQGDSAKKN
tara:strand:+ start:245 stop:373 length:129 start_codon:yes stop_codon:yes gene_type:complete